MLQIMKFYIIATTTVLLVYKMAIIDAAGVGRVPFERRCGNACTDTVLQNCSDVTEDKCPGLFIPRYFTCNCCPMCLPNAPKYRQFQSIPVQCLFVCTPEVLRKCKKITEKTCSGTFIPPGENCNCCASCVLE